jgi:hypothetical protein
MTFWAVFIRSVMVPALALAFELGRFFMPIQKLQRKRVPQQLRIVHYVCEARFATASLGTL